MSEFKGTPGPWTGKDVGICKQDDAGLQIGFIMSFDETRVAECAANARLIAAAPELLEALRQLRDYVEDMHAMQYGHNWVDESHPMYLAQAAIAKALGE